jgi:hypothetical protein
VREQAALTGKLPHEILLDMSRGLPVRIMVDSGKVDADGEKVFVESWQALDVEQVKDAAKAGAPFFAPKLSTVETMSGLTDEQLLEIATRAAAEAGISLGNDGAGAESQAPEPASTRTRVRIKTGV